MIMMYRGNYGCSGCGSPNCFVCRDTKTCPRCGQGKLPIGKHGKCTVCGFQVAAVIYDKEETWDDTQRNRMSYDDFEGRK